MTKRECQRPKEPTTDASQREAGYLEGNSASQREAFHLQRQAGASVNDVYVFGDNSSANGALASPAAVGRGALSRRASLVNRAEIRRRLLAYAKVHRAHQYTRVSEGTLNRIEAMVEAKIRSEVHQAPSRGKTL